MEGFLEEGTFKLRSEASQWGRHSSQVKQNRKGLKARGSVVSMRDEKKSPSG